MLAKRVVRSKIGRAVYPFICAECRAFSTTFHNARWRPLVAQPHQIGSKGWSRGVKRQTSLAVKAIPQGSLPENPLDIIDPDDGPAFPTVVQQAKNNMEKFSHCVVLTRVGNFYELYFEHAEEYGPLLNLKVAQKPTRAGPVPMSGFQFSQLDRYLKVLVQDLGKYVAIAEEYANDPSQKLRSGGLLFDRRVARIITPGTLIDEKFMDPWENNFLLSIHADPRAGDLEAKSSHHSGKATTQSTTSVQQVGLSWLDLSSGDFFTQATDIISLPSVIARIGPREIVLDQAFENIENSRLMSVLKEGHHIITYHQQDHSSRSVDEWAPMLVESAAGLDPEKFSQVEVAAGNFLLQYVNSTQLESKTQLQAPVQRHDEEYMLIDRNSLRALEVKSTIRDGNYEGSLLHAVRRTVTKSGTRLLSQRLSSPSMSLEEINQRLDLVSELQANPILRQDLVILLRNTFDSIRLVQKFSFGRGDADDLLSLSKTIQVTAQITELLQTHMEMPNSSPSDAALTTKSQRGQECFRQLLNRLSMESPIELSVRISKAIDEDMVSEVQRLEDREAADLVELAEDVLNEESGEGKLRGIPKNVKKAAASNNKQDTISRDDVWIMRRSANAILTRLHKELDRLLEEVDELSATLKEKTGAQSLTLRWTPGLGHIVHIKGKDLKASLGALGNTRSVSASKSTQSLHLSEWTQLGNKIEVAKLRIRAEETRIFDLLRKLVIHNLVKLRKNAAVLDEIDVACSFATLASERNLIRPILNHKTTHRIVGGRHPVVEVGLAEQGRQFTTNDCVVGDEERILLITGPNMGGKSTFLRQNALISILAQTGSFVPADYVQIGLVDKIFSRVGSADNLYNDQSTFMVEMLETAEILKQATSRSFVIMDEVGRGTTPEDGIAVGFAALWHLYHHNGCRALFATHFHALADMTRGFEEVGCYCTDVVEESDGSFSYVHRLRKGVNRESHALKVARVAGMPEDAIAIAAKVLEQLRPRLQDLPTLSATNA
ncbi:2 protein [Venturia nashicola]|uniref:2 protein n=1 Tax=Venturia nashicola TaxID=86259 RepID=A0A4Z1P830_9PEZI|nr:2 protein [Venturia nashicola]TLD26153.1 2 protein [Venturia nashicola]